jgi:tRNA threonylcarbamoyladenosine biosynthesis protein TsaB
MNYILHIETSTKACSAGISLDGKLLVIRETNSDEYVHSELLTVYIEQMLDELAIEPKALAAVAVTSGPGSYTGLRIGVSTAKGLCYALQIPLIAVDALVSLKEQISEAQQNVCAVIDARRMEVFSAIYAPDGAILKTISADVLDESSYAEFEPLLIVGDAVPKLKELWSERTIDFNDTVFASVKGQVRLAHQKFINQEFEDVAYFEPFYLKDFIAGK